MKAARIAKYGHEDVVHLVDIDRPAPGRGQVLLEVHASSINPVDIATREGRMKGVHDVELPMTLGVDVAGVVTELGPGTTELSVGDEVYGSASVTSGGSGAFAEYATAPVETLAKKPHSLRFVEAAAVALTGVSAVQALQDHLKLQRGQRILIHGAAGGIGTVAVQLAKHLGAQVTATATGDGIDYVRRLHAGAVIDYKANDFEGDGARYDAILDTIGDETYTRSFAVLKPGGTIVSLKHPVDAKLMSRHAVKALFMQTRVTTKTLDILRTLVEERIVHVHVERTFPLERIGAAFIAKERGHFHGKIGIEVPTR